MNIWTLMVAVLVAVVGAGAWGFFRLRDRWRNRLAITHAMTCFRRAPRIRLQRVEPFKWSKPARAEARVTALQALGFESLGAFRVAETGPGRMFVLRQPGWGLVALVQEDDSAGTWTDVGWFDPGGTTATYASNVLKRENFFLSAAGPDIHLPGEAEATVVEAVCKAAGNDARLRELTSETVIAAMEEAYACSADQQLLRPIEEAELRRVLATGTCDDGEELDENLLRRVQSFLPPVVSDRLRSACRAQFVREMPLSAREWQESRGRLLVLHDRTPLAELAAQRIRGVLRASEVCRTPALRQRLKRLKAAGPSPRAAFAELNRNLPAWERYTKLGQVTRPIPADIYCAPVDRPTT